MVFFRAACVCCLQVARQQYLNFCWSFRAISLARYWGSFIQIPGCPTSRFLNLWADSILRIAIADENSIVSLLETCCDRRFYLGPPKDGRDS